MSCVNFVFVFRNLLKFSMRRNIQNGIRHTDSKTLPLHHQYPTFRRLPLTNLGGVY
jgi:hypothetical protein